MFRPNRIGSHQLVQLDIKGHLRQTFTATQLNGAGVLRQASKTTPMKVHPLHEVAYNAALTCTFSSSGTAQTLDSPERSGGMFAIGVPFVSPDGPSLYNIHLSASAHFEGYVDAPHIVPFFARSNDAQVLVDANGVAQSPILCDDYAFLPPDVMMAEEVGVFVSYKDTLILDKLIRSALDNFYLIGLAILTPTYGSTAKLARLNGTLSVWKYNEDREVFDPNR